MDQDFLLKTLVSSRKIIKDEMLWLEVCCEDTDEHEKLLIDIDKLIKDLKVSNKNNCLN
jgi:hypothetical protein